MHVRKLIVGAIIVASVAVAVIGSQGCIEPGTNAGTTCDHSFPLKCCQCPWPEDCPPYAPSWPKLPAECEQYVDGGLDVQGDVFGGGSASLCSNGTCVSPAPDGWKHVAFAISWPEPPPACPEDSPIVAFEGSPAPPERTCPECSCDEPEGACVVPTMWTASSAACNMSGGVETIFDAPAGWDGSCVSTNAIPQGKLCGGVPCVQSLTLSLPILDEKPCAPRTEGLAELPPIRAWNDGPRAPIGRACTTDTPLPICSGRGCVGTNSAFAACIMHDGNEVCPEGWNGERHVLYSQIEDTRECTTCECEPPTGGLCQAKWRAFSDSSCTTEVAANDLVVDMTMTPCTYVAPGVALAGKSAEILSYTKGSCAPIGSDLVGDLKLDGQVTICCFAEMM